MKPLLTKTTKPFMVYVSIVLIISVPVYYFVIDAVWKGELDEHNRIIADKTAFGLNRLKLSGENLQSSINLWNSIQPGTNIRTIKPEDPLNDSIYTMEQQRSYVRSPSIDRLRCLSTVITVNGKPFRLIVETNIEESQETIAIISATTAFFFILIAAGLFYLTRKLSITVWKPFRDTLGKLKTFNLNNQTRIELESTDTTEFEELNQSLTRLIARNVSVYKTQKEFTENASHELQTPLAILKNKMDVLLQDENLTERQYQIAEEMNKALIRSSRINKNLLLLAKIENSQFDRLERIAFDALLRQCMDVLQEHFEQKGIKVNTDIALDVFVNGSCSLAEILINNMLLNAIRHTPQGKEIAVYLSGSRFDVTNSGERALDSTLLFKRFSRMSPNTSGSGLGLAIIQEICNVHGWYVHYGFESNHHIFSVLFRHA